MRSRDGVGSIVGRWADRSRLAWLVGVVYPDQAATSLGAVDQMASGAVGTGAAATAAASDTAVSSSDRLPAWSGRFGFSRRRNDKVLVEDFVRRND